METTKDKVIRKLTSRKLWASIVSFVTLLIVAAGHSEAEAAQVASIIMAGATVISYIVAEGMADAAGAETPVGVPGEIMIDDEIEIDNTDTMQ